ncbi:hypothetical protein HZA42_00145 [Candidatus Peregrinibacteria bacterium]|nr:hypothetical protein [Candidatus Peregrinibacteria bacterium]
MSLTRLKETFFGLPKQIKFIGIGSLILVISTLLPWYGDLDSYKIGDEFLGVTGPASFVGIVVLALAGLSMWLFSYRLLEKRMPRLPVREGIVHLFVAAESLFLLIVVNSIFFHPKFGVNITLKESRFGMTLAVLGSVLVFVGGYLLNKEETKKDSETGKLEPLIKLQSAPKYEVPAPQPQHSIIKPATQQSAYQRIQERMHHHSPLNPRESTGLPYKETVKGFQLGEKSSAPAATPANSGVQKDPKKDNFMLRMDL